MRIAIFSDLHIGFGKGTTRQDEAFEQARQAFELALKEKADLILLQGDLFNEAIPTQEAWLQMFQLFSFLRKENHAEKSTVKKSGREKIEHFEFNHVPVISIAGTHEFRSKDFKNALEVLQEAGCLVYLHESKAEFEKNGYPGSFRVETYRHFPYFYATCIDANESDGRMRISHYMHSTKRAETPMLELSRISNSVAFNKYWQSINNLLST